MSETLRMASEVVANRISELSCYELSLAASVVDQLSAELDDLIHQEIPSPTRLQEIAAELDVWVIHHNAVLAYWSGISTGKDEEQEWEIDDAWKQKEREDRLKRRAEKRMWKDNNLDDDYEL
jgi:hypothetical protein